jgi:hypothetical protein
MFVSAMMNLANEIYHYSMGIMLSETYKCDMAVETQASAAFDDLLMVDNIVCDEVPYIPRLSVPRTLSKADPIRLASIVRHFEDPDSRIGKRRAEWISKRTEWENEVRSATSDRDRRISESTRNAIDARTAYAKDLAKFFGYSLSFEHTEGIFSTVMGSIVKPPIINAASAAITTAIGSTLIPAPLASASGIAAGYVIGQVQKRITAGVFRKFRVFFMEKQMLSEEQIRYSQRIAARIKQRKSPSSILIDRSACKDIISMLKEQQAV